MKNIIYRLTIVTALTVTSISQLYAQSSNEEYTPFSSSSPYSTNDDLSGFGDDIVGPATERTPINDGYAAIILLAVPYAIYIYLKKRRTTE